MPHAVMANTRPPGINVAVTTVVESASIAGATGRLDVAVRRECRLDFPHELVVWIVTFKLVAIGFHHQSVAARIVGEMPSPLQEPIPAAELLETLTHGVRRRPEPVARKTPRRIIMVSASGRLFPCNGNSQGPEQNHS